MPRSRSMKHVVILERREKSGSNYYNIHKLLYYEVAEDLDSALFSEKQIKNYSRSKKIDLIISLNPHWIDLYDQIQD